MTEPLPVRTPQPVIAKHVPVDLATLARLRDALVSLP
jgi:hypothetical protein